MFCGHVLLRLLLSLISGSGFGFKSVELNWHGNINSLLNIYYIASQNAHARHGKGMFLAMVHDKSKVTAER